MNFFAVQVIIITLSFMKDGETSLQDVAKRKEQIADHKAKNARSQNVEKHGSSEDISNRLRFHFRNDLFGHEDPVVLVEDTIEERKVKFEKEIQLKKFKCITRSNNLNIVAKYVGVVDVEHVFFKKFKYSRLGSKKDYKDNVPFGVFEIEASKEDHSLWTSVGVECYAEHNTGGGYIVRIKEPFKPLHIIGDFVNHFVLTGNERENKYDVHAEISETNDKIVEAIQLSQPAFNVYTQEYHIMEYLYGTKQIKLKSSSLNDLEGMGITYNSQNSLPRKKLVIRKKLDPNEKNSYNAFISTFGITKFRITDKGWGYDSEGSMTENPIVDAFCFETPQKVKKTKPESDVFKVDIQKTFESPKTFESHPNYDILVSNSNEDMSCVVLLQNEVCYLYESIFSSAPQDLNAIDHAIVGSILKKEGFNCKEYVIWIGKILMERSSITHALEQLRKRPEIGINKEEDHTNNAPTPTHSVIDFAHNGISASNVNKEEKTKVHKQVEKVAKEQQKEKTDGHKAENDRTQNSPTKKKWAKAN